jgi:autotransporter adhesin
MEGTMLISQHNTNNTHWTRKLFVGVSALALAAVLVPGGFVPETQAFECTNNGAAAFADPNDDGQDSNTACGSTAQTSSAGATALGFNAQATGNTSTALGISATATAAGGATALGGAANASGLASTALGGAAQATDTDATAVGVSAQATNTGSTALGRSANASAQGAVALGANSVADEINTVSVGEAGVLTRRITNVAMGARGNDAVTVKQLKKSLKKSFRKGKAKIVKGTIQTSSQAKTNSQAKTTASTTQTKTKSSGGSRGSGSGGPATVSQTSFDQFASKTETQIDRLAQRDNKLAEGIAVVAALAQPVLLPGQHFAMRAGWGGYDSANAVAFSAAGVVADNLLRSGHGTLSLDGGVGYGTDEGEVVGRAGATFGW